MSSAVMESAVEVAAVAWLGALGYFDRHGPDIGTGAPNVAM